MKTKLLGCALVPLLAQTTCIMVSEQAVAARGLSLDAGKLIKGKQKSNLINIAWKESDKEIYLQKLTINGKSDKDIDVFLNIPGKIGGKTVSTMQYAFNAMTQTGGRGKIRLNLIFKEVNGKKVLFPKDCRGMFWRSKNLCSIDFRGVDTSSTTDMRHMFEACSSIKTLDLSPFDMTKVGTRRTEKMFYCCTNLKLINISSFNSILPENDSFFLYRMITAVHSSDIASKTYAATIFEAGSAEIDKNIENARAQIANRLMNEGIKFEKDTGTQDRECTKKGNKDKTERNNEIKPRIKEPEELLSPAHTTKVQKRRWDSKVWKRLANLKKSITSWLKR